MTAYYPQAAKYLFREFPGYEENIWRGAMKIYNESSKIWTANNILCSNHDVKQAGHLAFVTSNKFFLINQFTERDFNTFLQYLLNRELCPIEIRPLRSLLCRVRFDWKMKSLHRFYDTSAGGNLKNIYFQLCFFFSLTRFLKNELANILRQKIG